MRSYQTRGETKTATGQGATGRSVCERPLHVRKHAFDSRLIELKLLGELLEDVTLDVSLPGIKYNSGPDDYFLVEQLQLARFDGKRWVLFGEIIGHE